MMGFWNIVQEVFMVGCVIIGGIFAVPVGFGVLVALIYWVFFLLEYPMELMFWILEKMLLLRKKERPKRRELEPPPPVSITYAPCINESTKPLEAEIKESLREMNDEHFH